MKLQPVRARLLALLPLAVLAAGSPPAAALAGTPQASITLTNSDAKYCYVHSNLWTLTKSVTNVQPDPIVGAGSVTWTITATKDTTSPPTFTIHGGLTVTNTGGAPATIGNIVINLQKPNSPKKGSNAPYVSIAADVADCTNGDAATSASVVAAGSQENMATNGLWGTGNYTVSGARGTFVESAGSGPLEFTDASSNTVFSMAPQMVIPVGGSVTLLYHATFQTSVLPPAGTAMRVEALVTFGNAGGRGGSGASAANIDINGNGVLGPEEANVRTVPSRVTMDALPATPGECNSTVTVTDLGITTTGTVATTNPVGLDQFPATVSETTSWSVSVDVDAGGSGGDVCNAAALAGAACGGTLTVVIGYDSTDPLYPIPIYATYECAPAAEASDGDCTTVMVKPGTGYEDGDFCTYTKGKFQWNANNPVANYLQANFAALFPSGLTIGIADGSGPSHDATWTDATKFRKWIAGGGPSGALTTDTINATSTSGGTLAKHAAALMVNIALSGSTGGQPAGLGYLKLAGTGTSLDGMTLSQILAVANAALGTGALPSDYTFGSLNDLLDNLNKAFDDCEVSGWAYMHLER